MYIFLNLSKMFKILIVVICIIAGIQAELYIADSSATSTIASYQHEMMQLLGLGKPDVRVKRWPSSLEHSASKYLLELYEELAIEEHEEEHALYRRRKRDVSNDNLVTNMDLLQIEKYNNIMTFGSKTIRRTTNIQNQTLHFNTNNVSRDLRLVHAELRLYQDPALGRHSRTTTPHNVSIWLYHQFAGRKRILSARNSTTHHKGWLAFNVTQLLRNWLQRPAPYGNAVRLGVSLLPYELEINADEIGLVTTTIGDHMLPWRPFILGYFNGPDLLDKVQKLRYRREVGKFKRWTSLLPNGLQPERNVYRGPRSCERLNFTLDFQDLQMHDWVIAPKKFEAFYCGGECNFPLHSHMNATNHAIVQTLMQLKQPHLPKVCCVPSHLGAISILHYVNDDSVNLSRYPQSVVKRCGCH